MTSSAPDAPGRRRPSRHQFVLEFFPEIRDATGTAGDTEGAIRMNLAACEAILADLILRYDKHLAEEGRGVLTLKLGSGRQEAGYVTVEALEADLNEARLRLDYATSGFLAAMIAAIRDRDPEHYAMVMLADNGRAQLLALERVNPAGAIETMMKELALRG